jgi:hypothetical protein
MVVIREVVLDDVAILGLDVELSSELSGQLRRSLESMEWGFPLQLRVLVLGGSSNWQRFNLDAYGGVCSI